MNEKHYIGKRVSRFEKYDEVGPITGIALLVDEENEYFAGNQNGYVLEIECPYGTQTMANNIMAGLQNKIYKGYRADNAPLAIDAELGDGITVNGLYSMLAYRAVAFGPGHMSEIAAPGSNEIEHEYPYISSTQRDINRKIAQTNSRITKTAEEITLEIQGLNQSVSTIKQYVDGITLSVKNEETSSFIELKTGETIISSGNITMKGLVTYKGLSAGTTTIDGACIQTGTIDAERLNLTKAISFDSLDNSLRKSIDTVDGWVYTDSTYIDGNKIMTGTVTARTIQGETVNILTDTNNLQGTITVGSYKGDINDEDGVGYEATGIRIRSNKNLTLEARTLYLAGGRSFVALTSGGTDYFAGTFLDCACHVTPAANNRYACGTFNFKWSDIYCVTQHTSSSDKTAKHDLEYDLKKYDDFFNDLQPMSFLFNEGTSGRRHIGFCAQDVEQSLLDNNLSSMDFAGLVKELKIDNTGKRIEGNYGYALRYGEFIALNTWQIQQLKKRVAELEAKLKEAV